MHCLHNCYRPPFQSNFKGFQQKNVQPVCTQTFLFRLGLIWLCVEFVALWKSGVLMVSGRTLCCVLGQDMSLSQCLSPRKCMNGYQQMQCWGWGVEILLVTSCYRNWDKLQSDRPLDLYADF